jgi:outer membrane protein insertion porin family
MLRFMRRGLGRHSWTAAVFAVFFVVASFGSNVANAQSRISEIRVEGTERIEPATVVSYLLVQPGDAFESQKLDDSLKTLFATGLFADVSLRVEGDVLVVTIVENPIINRIAFEGNRRIETKDLEKEVQLRPRVVYTRSRVQADVDRMQELYRRRGRFSARIDPKVILLPQNRVDLVFEIEEGPQSKVRRIDFIGNERYSDGDLRDAVLTREAKWWRFLTTNDTYDPDRVAYDGELLRRFYSARGYADFRVVSTVAELTPGREDFFVTFTVDEGARYRLGNIEIDTDIEELKNSNLRDAIIAKSGDWYNGKQIEDSVDALTDKAGDLQFAFVEINPRLRRDREKGTIDVIFRIDEGPRVFVEKINITGNVRTVDEVIRRELLLAEGDPFNTSKLKRSEQRVDNLGYFKEVKIDRARGAEPDRSVLDVKVEEQSTGELQIGAGYSTQDGPLVDLRISERNLLGEGKIVSLSTVFSGRSQEFDGSYTEPYFLGRNLAAGIDVFHVNRDYQREASYDQSQTGFALRVGYPLTEFLRQRIVYRLVRNNIKNVADFASSYIREQQGVRWTSLIGQELVYDTLDNRQEPTKGYILRLGTDIAGLGGDDRFVRAIVGGAIYFPILETWVLSVSGEAAGIWGLGQDILINNRFFLGGDSLRGFQFGGVGPRDLSTNDTLGGNYYARGSVELTLPLGLPSEFGIKAHVFSDVGVLNGLDLSNRANIANDWKPRASAGVGISWKSPFGPIRIDLAEAFLKEKYDETEFFRFSFGTRF